MSKNWYPVINYETCIVCGACVDKCSHEVYEVSSGKVNVINPDNCIDRCRSCKKICPSDSIQYVGDTGQKSTRSCCCS